MNNPYAPPETRGEAPPRQGDWYTEGTTILVADGAVLPAIDLETGESSEGLIEVRRMFSIAGATLSLWCMIPALLNLMPKEWKRVFRPSHDNFGILITALLVLMAVHLFLVFWRPRLLGKHVRFRMYRTQEAERKTKWTRIIAAAWFSISVLIMLVPGIVIVSSGRLSDFFTLVFGLMGIGMISMFGCAAWQLYRLPKIRLKGFSGQWLRIHGACDEALAHLRKIESERTIHHAE